MEELKNIKRRLSLSVVILLLGCVHAATPTSKLGLLTNEERKKFLIAHNNFRRNASKEFEGVKQPMAANMKRMYWSAALEADAVAWNVYEMSEEGLHRGPSKVQGLREYLAILGVTDTPSVGQNSAAAIDNPTRIVQTWYGETHQYTLQDNVCSTNDGCNHYSQVMWADSKYIGCSIAQGVITDVFASCNYFPGGNVIGSSPYKEGEPCSLCHNLTKDGFTECEDGLCQPKDKCSPVKECKVIDTVNCLCSEADYSGIVTVLVKANGHRLAPSSLLLLLSVVGSLLISPLTSLESSERELFSRVRLFAK